MKNIAVPGFDAETNKIDSQLTVDSPGCFKPNGEASHKLQLVLLHNNVYLLSLQVSKLEQKIDELVEHLSEP